MMRKSIPARWARPNATLNARSAALSSAPLSLAGVRRLTFPDHPQNYRRSGGCRATNNFVGVTEQEPRAKPVVAPCPVAAMIETLAAQIQETSVNRIIRARDERGFVRA